MDVAKGTPGFLCVRFFPGEAIGVLMMAPRDASRMPGADAREALDYVVLADALAAIGYPMRLELLDHLRFPQAIGELRVAPRRQDDEGSPDRAVARQTVQYHLEKLVEGGFVREAPTEGKGPTRYVVSPPRLYAVIEELRALSHTFAGRGGAGDATGTIAGGTNFEPLAGPRLVLVHGAYEGKQFPLDPKTASEGRWLVGRRRGHAVTLDYDPFVSLDNTAIVQEGGAFRVTDLPGSKNGTRVNWNPVAASASKPLVRGDLVGVGRSILLFRDD
jgi:hypothetical protein